MFDVGFSEILLVAIAALIAIGPKDLPDILFRLGRLTRQGKMFVQGVRNQYAEIMHEAEVTHYRKELQALVKDDGTKPPVMTPLETAAPVMPVPVSEPVEVKKDGTGGA